MATCRRYSPRNRPVDKERRRGLALGKPPSTGSTPAFRGGLELRLPVRPASGHDHDPEALRPPAELVDVRLMGQPAAVELVTRQLRRVLPRSEEHTSELQSRGHIVCR